MRDRSVTHVDSPEQAAEEYERLRQKHQRCEERLAELRGRLLLSEEEKVEEITLKKQKLHFKDRMEALVRNRG